MTETPAGEGLPAGFLPASCSRGTARGCGLKTSHGSCFGGAVAFEADGDLAKGTMRCNCRFCRKMRYWEMLLPDAEGLRLLKGADALAETPRMQDDGWDMHHVFCGRCGMRLWTHGNLAEWGGRITMVLVRPWRT